MVYLTLFKKFYLYLLKIIKSKDCVPEFSQGGTHARFIVLLKNLSLSLSLSLSSEPEREYIYIFKFYIYYTLLWKV